MLTGATTNKRQTSSQLLIYIHQPSGAILINPDEPLVPAAASLAIVQASVALIQNITGLSVQSVGLYQPTTVQSNGGVNIAVIVGPVVGAALLIALVLLAAIVVILIV